MECKILMPDMRWKCDAWSAILTGGIKFTTNKDRENRPWAKQLLIQR